MVAATLPAGEPWLRETMNKWRLGILPWPRRSLAAAAGCLLKAFSLARAEEIRSLDVTPYLWVASVDAETSLPSVPPSTPPEASRFDIRIAAGAMLAAQARYRSVGLFVDFAWLRLDSEASEPGPAFSAVDLKSDFIHSTAALTYTLPLKGKLHADALAGARLWNVSEDLEFKSGALAGLNQT